MNAARASESQKDYPAWKRKQLKPVPLTDVRLSDAFWLPRLEANRWPDNGGQVHGLILPDDVALQVEHRENLLNGVTVIRGQVPAYSFDKDGSSAEMQEFVAIPYYAWSHRGVGEMAVWLPRRGSVR